MLRAIWQRTKQFPILDVNILKLLRSVDGAMARRSLYLMYGKSTCRIRQTSTQDVIINKNANQNHKITNIFSLTMFTVCCWIENKKLHQINVIEIRNCLLLIRNTYSIRNTNYRVVRSNRSNQTYGKGTWPYVGRHESMDQRNYHYDYMLTTLNLISRIVQIVECSRT